MTMNRVAWGLLVFGVAVGAVAALGSAVAHTSAIWAGLAATAAALMTASLLGSLDLPRPAARPVPVGPPRMVQRVAEAAHGDVLAREYVLEQLDALRAEHTSSGRAGRLRDDSTLYRLPEPAFSRLVNSVLLEEEATP
ncbi:MAG TPA: hypothetical protein VEY07_03115 [Thermoplasmata archaeon]|nr:hypothetical protein [Thermoplasmata archaeon]